MSEVASSGATRKSTATTTKAVIVLLVLFLVVWAAIKLTEGPSTQDEVCASFDKLGQRASKANGIIDNPVFSQASDLSDLAGRFDGPTDLSRDAEVLNDIGDSDSTSSYELMQATQQIARLCGHKLGDL